MTTTTKKVYFYLNTGAKATDPMLSREYSLNGIKSRMVVNAAGDIKVFKTLTSGADSKNTIATGNVYKHADAGKWSRVVTRENGTKYTVKSPDIKMEVRAGSKSPLVTYVGWLDDEGSSYRLTLDSKLPRPKCFSSFPASPA